MQLNVPPALEVDESGTDDGRLAWAARIEEVYLEAERGELIEVSQVRRAFIASMTAYTLTPSAKAADLVEEAIDSLPQLRDVMQRQ